MKNSILLALFMSIVLTASAQWVTIPDANFADKLNELFPECMDGNLMDTTCTAIIDATTLNVSNQEIADLAGIQYFANLEVLNCSVNDLITLPELPASLSYLSCNSNEINALPELPASLVDLRCYHNSLSELPELPDALNYLECGLNNLLQLPELPSALTELRCGMNSLTELPELPSSLTYLECWDNNLTELPELPNSLTELTCYINVLTELPVLPICLNELRCHENNLTDLPELPFGLQILKCEFNELTCLPTLPMSLDNNSTTYGFNISNNLFTCLPNYVPAMSGNDNSVWLSYPLCDLSDMDNNPYGCSNIEGIAGTVFEDEDGNCEEDEEESGLTNIPLQLLDAGNNLIASTATYSNKIYNFVADTGTYSVKLEYENLPFHPSCDDPGATQEVVLTEGESAAFGVDFGVECMPGLDLGTQSIGTMGWVFPGEEHVLNISAGDIAMWYGLDCANGVGGSVTVEITGPVSYVGPAESALIPEVSGDIQLTYNIIDFGDIDFDESFGIILETNTDAQEGDLVCIEVIVDPIAGDINPENNTYNHCYEVVNSYDPNIKQVWPQNVEPGYDDYFNYTIYFQNTGNAPAFNIRVADTLDTNLDLSTFEVTAYSHECLTYVSGNVATFRFNNIMLPDSTSDFDGSIGYVQYRIKPIADLPVGTVIENTAHIFFDFNDAIVTNTTQNEFVIDTGLDQPQQQLATVFPNPGTGQFNVLFKNSYSGTTHLEVYNLSGQRLLQQQVNENRVVLDLTEYPSGMYLLHLRNEQGSEAVRIVKH